MLTKEYCQSLENSLHNKHKEIRVLRSQLFFLKLLLVFGWGLLVLAQIK